MAIETVLDDLIKIYQGIAKDVPAECASRNLPIVPHEKPFYGKLFKKQRAVFDHRMSAGSGIHTTVIGGGYGGGKSIVAMAILTTMAIKYPRSHWTVVRDTLVSCKESIMADYRQQFWQFYERENKAESTFYFKNGSRIVFKGENIKEDPNLNRWKSYATNGFFLEQIEGMSQQFYEQALSRAGRWTTSPQPPAFVLCSVNPTTAWPRQRFYEPHRDGVLSGRISYIQMLIEDNPIYAEDPNYMAKFEDMDPIFRRAMLGGDWDALLEDEAGQLFPSEWLKLANERVKTAERGEMISTGVDVAREGKDETAVAPNYGTVIGVPWVYAGKSTPDGQSVIAILKTLYTDLPFVPVTNVDVIGVGGSVVDQGKEVWPGKVRAVHVGKGSKARTANGMWKFEKFKAQLFWHFRARIDPKGEDPIALELTPRLMAGFRAFRYEYRGDKIVIEKKDEMKKRIGRSPDPEESMIYSLAHEITGDMQALAKMFNVSG